MVFALILGTFCLWTHTAVAEEGFLELDDGAQIYLVDVGRDSSPVIFIHGWCMSSRLWNRQLVFFANSYRTIAYDLRAHGKSAKVTWGHTLSRYARDLRELIIKKELNDVILIGWSMGASVVFDYVRQFGTDRIGAIVIVDMVPYFFTTEEYEYGYAGEWKYCDREEITRAIVLGYQEVPEVLGKDFVRSMFKGEPPADLVEWIFAEFQKTPSTVASLLAFDVFTNDYREVLGKIGVPTLICVGSDGKVFAKGTGGYLAERIPNSSLVIFEESGHVPFLEERDRFNSVVKEFVDGLL